MDFFKQNIIPGEVFVQLIAFLIVFWVLKRLAWQPILDALEARRNKIKSDALQNESVKKELDALKADYDARLQKIDEEARVKIQDAIEEGRRHAKDLQEQARAEAQATFEKNKENLNLEVAKARIQLRQEITGLVVQVSEKVICEKMTGAKQQDKISEMIQELDESLKGGGKK